MTNKEKLPKTCHTCRYYHEAVAGLEEYSVGKVCFRDVIVPSVDPDGGCEIWEGDNENQRTNRISTDL